MPQKYSDSIHLVGFPDLNGGIGSWLTPFAGKVYGLIICLAGLFNFSQSGLDAMTHKVFDGNPVPVNVMLLLISLTIGACLTVFVWRKSRSLGKAELRAEADNASEHLMLGATVDTRDYGTL
jgi:hypothetical protein